MRILAIDPGTVQSAFCEVDYDTYEIHDFGKIDNADLLSRMQFDSYQVAVIEMVACYGMPVGREVFETCVWIGRFEQAAESLLKLTDRIYREEEKQTLCHSLKAKDSNIMRALIDRFAQHDLTTGKGTKFNPDWFYGFKKDIWAAYAVAVTWIDKRKEQGFHDRAAKPDGQAEPE